MLDTHLAAFWQENWFQKLFWLVLLPLVLPDDIGGRFAVALVGCRLKAPGYVCQHSPIRFRFLLRLLRASRFVRDISSVQKSRLDFPERSRLSH